MGYTTLVNHQVVLYSGKDLTGVSPTAQKLMTHQRNSLTRVLKDMQKAHPEFSIQVTSSNSGSYVEYLQQLQTTKVNRSIQLVTLKPDGLYTTAVHGLFCVPLYAPHKPIPCNNVLGV